MGKRASEVTLKGAMTSAIDARVWFFKNNNEPHMTYFQSLNHFLSPPESKENQLKICIPSPLSQIHGFTLASVPVVEV